MKKKILFCITARASFSRIKNAILALKKKKNIEVIVLASGSALLENYGRVVELIKKEGIKVAEELYTSFQGDTSLGMALTTASTIEATARSLVRISPDIVVTIADRYETLGSAIAASYCGFPLAHIQGGEVTGNIDERVRHAITKLSDIHLVSNQNSRSRIIKMGEKKSSIFVTGCPSLDIIREAKKEIDKNQIEKIINYYGVGKKFKISEPFVVVLQHSETEAFHKSYEHMIKILEIVERIKITPLIFWPNIDVGSDAISKAIRVMRERGALKNARFLKNIEGKMFVKLLSLSKCLIGNSSAGIRECSFMGVPVVNIGKRQEGRLCANNVINVGWNSKKIFNAINKQINRSHYKSSKIYGDSFAGKKIAEVLSKNHLFKNKRFVD
jgi:UDP-hydrolysing UDP-N-acetyl-D-glucosamine 2-epimerase